MDRLGDRQRGEEPADVRTLGRDTRREAGDQHRFRQRLGRFRSELASIEKRSSPLHRREQFVAGRVEDDAHGQLPVDLQRNGDAVVGEAVHVVRRAIERIDEPAAGRFGVLAQALFADEAMIGKRGVNQVVDHLLRRDIGLGDQIGPRLLGDRKPARPILQHLARRQCRPLGHREKWSIVAKVVRHAVFLGGVGGRWFQVASPR